MIQATITMQSLQRCGLHWGHRDALLDPEKPEYHELITVQGLQDMQQAEVT